MKTRRIMRLGRFATLLVAAGLLFLSASAAPAQEDETPMMGRHLMTEEERDQYRTAMPALRVQEERDAIRAKHQKEMRARAKEQGVELSDGPGRRGRGPRRERAGEGRPNRLFRDWVQAWGVPAFISGSRR